MPAALPPDVAQYLQRHHVMTLSSQGPDGPWGAAVFYVNDGTDLVFLSSPASRHARNLALDPRCAATIQEDCNDWTQIKGVQLEGHVTPLQGDELASGQRLYGQKFPLVASRGNLPVAIAVALQRVRWYRLAPQRLYFIDNGRGFGHRDEIAPAPSERLGRA